MKKVTLALLAITCSMSVFAQGTVNFYNRFAGGITHVYLGGNSQIIGNGLTGDSVAGTVNWTGFTALSGSGYSAVVLAAPGLNAAESSLVASVPITTFRTGTAAGNFAQATAVLGNVASGPATLEIAVWDNKGGTISSWSQALTAWQAGQCAAGRSGTFNLAAVGEGTVTPPNMDALQSFNIFLQVPEPSTMALAGLGAAALLIFRRRK